MNDIAPVGLKVTLVIAVGALPLVVAALTKKPAATWVLALMSRLMAWPPGTWMLRVEAPLVWPVVGSKLIVCEASAGPE